MAELIILILMIAAYFIAICHIASIASDHNLPYGKFFFVGLFLSPFLSGIMLICNFLGDNEQ